MKMRPFFLFLMPALLVLACEPTPMESRHSGAVDVGVDDSYGVMLQSQADTYMHFNPKGTIRLQTAPEGEIMKALLNDSIEAAVICRDLTTEERDIFLSRQRKPMTYKIATDGIALAFHPENTVSELTFAEVEGLFRGTITKWSQLDSTAEDSPVEIVFDNPGSSNARYVKDHFLAGGEFPSNFFAVHSNDEVINHLSTHKNAIGILSVGLIADVDDPEAQGFREKVKVAAIEDTSATAQPGTFRQPFQAYLFDGSYPLRRDLYYIRTGLSNSLGTGFASFILGQKGQLIIHKTGMVAATSPTRIVRIVEE
ncbi:MAG: substrate-binding domain-containing protein [Flavobacteriales bacterium]|nr:substrate-binding domain-containing protein [Flavobacteriales bacterium]